MALPHPDKVRQGTRGVNRRDYGQGGEDAYFVSSSSDGSRLGMGVADGVYMWRMHGIDAGMFSRSLMDTAKREVEGGEGDALEVLKAASRQVLREGIQGASTACVVLIDHPTGTLRSATLGDSGFLVAGRLPMTHPGQEGRPKLHVKYRSPQQEHQFGFPYQ
jgi:protein phosphatase PTC7